MHVLFESDTLGILTFNENKNKKMIQILSHLHQYVPVMEYDEDLFVPSINEEVTIPKALFSPVLLGEDQLTAARARGAKKAKVSADIPLKGLEGIVPAAEDCDKKMNLSEKHSNFTIFFLYSITKRVMREKNKPLNIQLDTSTTDKYPTFCELTINSRNIRELR